MGWIMWKLLITCCYISWSPNQTTSPKLWSKGLLGCFQAANSPAESDPGGWCQLSLQSLSIWSICHPKGFGTCWHWAAFHLLYLELWWIISVESQILKILRQFQSFSCFNYKGLKGCWERNFHLPLGPSGLCLVSHKLSHQQNHFLGPHLQQIKWVYHGLSHFSPLKPLYAGKIRTVSCRSWTNHLHIQ